jgi:hypothetical protein
MRFPRPRARTALVAGAAGLLLAACSTSAVIKTTTTAGSPFCTSVEAIATQSAPLNDAAAQTSNELLQQLPPIVTSLKALETAAPATDTVNGKPLKTDIGTMASVNQDIIDELQRNTNVKNALATVNGKEGQAMTDAVGRFDAFASQVCRVGQATPGASTSTTIAPTGPTAP